MLNHFGTDPKRQRIEEAVLRYEQYVDMVAPWLVARGISKATAERFRLGCVADPFPPHRFWEGRCLIPYLDMVGPVALKARCVRCDKCDSHGKYTGEEGIEPLLFNVTALLDDTETLYVVEGEFDAMVLAGEMGLTAVAYPGGSSWRSEFTRAVSPDWPRIVVLADGDEPGRLAAKKVAKELHAEIIVLPDGEDVSSLYVKRGKRGLESVLGLDPTDSGDDPFPDLPPF